MKLFQLNFTQEFHWKQKSFRYDNCRNFPETACLDMIAKLMLNWYIISGKFVETYSKVSTDKAHVLIPVSFPKLS